MPRFKGANFFMEKKLVILTPRNDEAESVRQSSFELLRIVAMFLVLIVHADFYSLGSPAYDDTVSHPVSSMMRYVVESLSLVCVNVYIIISGYFGIKLRVKGVLKFVFLVVFWRLLINIGFLGAENLGVVNTHLTFRRFVYLCIPGFEDWFVMAYIMLLFFAPLLNSFIEKCSLRRLWVYVLVYEGCQILFSWGIDAWYCFNMGYSFLSFVGLYLLGAALRRTKCGRMRYNPIVCYLVISVAVAMIVFITNRFVPETLLSGIVNTRFYPYYNGLFVLLSSAFLFLGFKRLNFSSRVVNYIAASSFAVYLLHMHPLIREFYIFVCNYLFKNYSTWPYIGLISAFIAGVFFTAVSVDLARRWLWSRISDKEAFKTTCGYVTKLLN